MSGINKLTDTKIKKTQPSDKIIQLGDGDRLWLVVYPSGKKVWRVKWKSDHRQDQFTIGHYPGISLKQARMERDRITGLLDQGIDPNVQKKAEKTFAMEQMEKDARTFRVVALEWHKKRTKVQTESTRRLKMQRLEKHVFPVIGDKPMASLTMADLVAMLQQIESTGHAEMARRVGQIVGQICRYARLLGDIPYDISTGMTEALEAKPPVKHRATITEPERVARLILDIDEYSGNIVTRYALRIMPYVFVRSQELRLARWSEINFEKHLWVIPKEHMKMKKQHVVPLASQVERLFRELHTWTGTHELIFPSTHSKTRAITDVCLLNALRRMGYGRDEMCIHGFRAMASTLLNEQGYRPDVIEAQLAHTDKNQVRAAYNHAQYLPERIRMMQKWADYLDSLKKTCRIRSSAEDFASAGTALTKKNDLVLDNSDEGPLPEMAV